jgi:hypothetical protein
MARFVYIDETGTNQRDPFLLMAAVLVDEEMVQPLASSLRKVTWSHLGWIPRDFEFHGREVWHGTRYWADKQYSELIAAYEAALALLKEHEIWIAHATINKPGLHARYAGAADDNAYLLALQFLLEKVDRNAGGLKVLVADEKKEHQLRAVRMVADMQEWGFGEVPGPPLRSVIDSLHYVSSHASPGVQMADLVSFVLQRSGRQKEGHSDAQAGMDRLVGMVLARRLTWREPWP